VAVTLGEKMEFEYSKKDLKKSPKSKNIEVYYERGFWRFDGASALLTTRSGDDSEM